MVVRKGELEKNFKEESAAALVQSLAKGQAEGLQKGLLEGRNKGRGEVLDKADGFFKIIGKIGGVYRELWKEKAPMMTALAVDAAEAIVNKEVENGKGLAAGALSACVGYLQKSHEVVFRVRPEDLAEVEAARSALRDQLDGLVNIEFKADDSLGSGDLIMESDAGRLDATMRARRERVMAVLREALDQGLVEELPPEDQEAMAQESPASWSSTGTSPAGANPGEATLAGVNPPAAPETIEQAAQCPPAAPPEPAASQAVPNQANQANRASQTPQAPLAAVNPAAAGQVDPAPAGEDSGASEGQGPEGQASEGQAPEPQSSQAGDAAPESESGSAPKGAHGEGS